MLAENNCNDFQAFIKIKRAFVSSIRKPFMKTGINYLTNNNSLYFGKGHNSLSTINSSLSI